MGIQSFTYTETLTLEHGGNLENIQIAYHTYGTLNPDKNNVIWVCHALTANSDVFNWWPGIFGTDELFNDQDYFIVCANALGSHYGTTNPLSIDPKTNAPYYLDFPQITIRDQIQCHKLLAEALEITEIEILIGASLGGQQALEWAISPNISIRKLIVIGTNAWHSPWGIAFNESQRLALLADPTFREQKNPDGGKDGLRAARSIALLSYRNYDTYVSSQREQDKDKIEGYRASSYQRYQGDKFVNRFNAYSYWYLSKAMDSHHLGRNRKTAEEVLRSIDIPTLVIGITSDILFPLEEQKLIAQYISGATYYELCSFYGHDGFLIETKKLTKVFQDFLTKKKDKHQLKAV